MTDVIFLSLQYGNSQQQRAGSYDQSYGRSSGVESNTVAGRGSYKTPSQTDIRGPQPSSGVTHPWQQAYGPTGAYNATGASGSREDIPSSSTAGAQQDRYGARDRVGEPSTQYPYTKGGYGAAASSYSTGTPQQTAAGSYGASVTPQPYQGTKLPARDSRF